ncbi:hypothetical protein I545_4256 [Mycobacterium kansasii 662]|uniref:Uncharacterized protein n=1 Tax=Mycobacterium kansasii 662 TaxID=1299326 RepID=X7ZCG3_MYCKA|nr:hypothetical protein I547_7634 [Mycobacterium kansasii 824]EUA16428.1 hypothetical protein I545_4256 [Mycobacterium kansasii 662]KEP40743.1 hypothetical protein MKSMC1_41070 [Mycobacterium kansasii]
MRFLVCRGATVSPCHQAPPAEVADPGVCPAPLRARLGGSS